MKTNVLCVHLRSMRRFFPLTLLLTLLLPAPASASLNGDGVNQFISVPGSTNLSPTPLTFEAWVYPTSTSCATILSRGDGYGNSTYIFQVGSDGGNCGVMKVDFWGAGAWDSSASTIPLNAWTHVAVTYDGTYKQFYINGALDNTITRPGPLYPTNSTVFIARQGTDCNCNYFQGQLAEVRIWNTVRTTSEVVADMGSFSGGEPGLVAYYPLNEGSGTNAYDISGNGHTGTVAVATGWSNSVPPFAPVTTAYALEFYGTNYLTINPGPSLVLSNQVTFEAWVRPESLSCMTILSRGDGGNGSDYIWQLNTDGHGNCGNGSEDLFGVGQWDVSPTNVVPLDTWTHVAVTYNGTYKVFYIDGVAVRTNSRPGLLSQSTTPLYIGRQGSTCDCNLFVGQMDEIRIWNTVLTAAQINQNFTKPLTGTEPGLVAYYRFDEGGGTNTADFSGHGNNATLSLANTWTNSGATFIFAPAISNQYVTNITSSSATFSTKIAPNGADTTVWFDYGLTTNYGTTITNTVSGTNAAPVTLNVPLSGLNVGTVYHAQWVASNEDGIVFGGDQTVTIPFFMPVNAGFPALRDGSMAAVGDYDNDGLLDILVLGWDQTSNAPVAQLWRNTGSGFAGMAIGLPAVSWGSIAWGDYDNDGRLDILLTGYDSNNIDYTQIWRNTGSGFSNVTAIVAPFFPQLDSGSAVWGDYDNDGKLDVLLTGEYTVTNGSTYSYVNVAQVWHNSGTNFVQTGVSLPGVSGGSSGWIDFNGDGLLDIFLSGYDNSGNPLTQLWRNTGHGFTNINVAVPQLGGASFGWGDFNSDGKLDFVVSGVSGSYPNTKSVTQVWTNSGTGFAKMADLPGLNYGSVSVADFDNDGLLDIVVTGSDDSYNSTTKVFRNIGSGFVDVTATYTPGVPNVASGFGAFADFDNDGRLDLLLGGNGTMQVLKNLGPVTNSPPTVPTGLTANISGSSMLLSWGPSSDAQTSSGSLTYNLRIGTTPGGSDILAPNSGSDGLRRLPALGPIARQQFQLALPPYPMPRYYCSVQSIDGGLAGSAFAPEVALNVPPTFTTWGRRGDGAFEAQFNVTGGVNYNIQASTDLLHWNDVLLFNFGDNGPFIFTDTSATNYPHRFYRIGAQ